MAVTNVRVADLRRRAHQQVWTRGRVAHGF